MKKSILTVITFAFVFMFLSCPAEAQLNDFLKNLKSIGKSAPSYSTTIAGLKEALSIGTINAVTSAAREKGYFNHPVIKIPLPDKIQTVAKALAAVGYQKQVDDFILRMNRAAEKAAPSAKNIFVDAVERMNFEDARQILKGGDTAATDYFKTKTSGPISGAFKPIIASSLNEAGATKAYKELMGKYTSSLSLIGRVKGLDAVDVDQYVTTKAMDGLFYLLAEEEKKIRTDPAARVTELLKTVFGK